MELGSDYLITKYSNSWVWACFIVLFKKLFHKNLMIIWSLYSFDFIEPLQMNISNECILFIYI